MFQCSRSGKGSGIDAEGCPASTRRAASSETEYATATVCVLPILSRHGPEVRMECCTAARQRLPRVQGAGFLRKHSRSGQPLSAALMCWIRFRCGRRRAAKTRSVRCSREPGTVGPGLAQLSDRCFIHTGSAIEARPQPPGSGYSGCPRVARRPDA